MPAMDPPAVPRKAAPRKAKAAGGRPHRYLTFANGTFRHIAQPDNPKRSLCGNTANWDTKPDKTNALCRGCARAAGQIPAPPPVPEAGTSQPARPAQPAQTAPPAVAAGLLPLVAHQHVHLVSEQPFSATLQPCRHLPSCGTSLALAAIRTRQLSRSQAPLARQLRCPRCGAVGTHLERTPGSEIYTAEPRCDRHAGPAAEPFTPQRVSIERALAAEDMAHTEPVELALRYTTRRGRVVVVDQLGLAHALHNMDGMAYSQRGYGLAADVVLVGRLPRSSEDDPWHVIDVPSDRSDTPAASA
ncbi:hypothetical protein [Nonomuraea sp. NPDC049646]|uniref:hypothetical protein n=1 Tax=unclassified Nonomuraea TaxID=2593643 RepID=UPI00378898FF